MVTRTLILLLTLAWAVINASITLYMGGNSWSLDGGDISDSGYEFRTLPAKFSSYFHTSSAATVTISIRMLCNVSSSVSVTLGSTTLKTATIPASKYKAVKLVGNFKTKVGYNKIVTTITNASNAKGRGLVEALLINGTLTNLYYNRDNVDGWFSDGRKGPNGMFWIEDSEPRDITYFYSEMTVPTGFDPFGTFFCPCSWSEGYFGIQHNADKQRVVLFSVWSGWNTDDPSQIPSDWTVRLQRLGPGVQFEDFGNEGSGGSSFLLFNWTTNTVYKFLLRAEPQKTNATVFTAWFNDPRNSSKGGWRLIASWLRPKVKTYLTGLSSFMETYMSDQGNVTKMVYFGNQWAYNGSKVWTELTAVSMIDEEDIKTGRRRDLDGGVYNGNQFFYKQNGFFDAPLYGAKKVTRTANKKPPNISFTSLP